MFYSYCSENLKVQTVYVLQFLDCLDQSASSYNDFHISIEFYRRMKMVKLSDFAEKCPYVQRRFTEVLEIKQVVSLRSHWDQYKLSGIICTEVHSS